ncbi:MAG: hypothetical protein IJ651_09765 [Bacteroidales bacterium]|nr:hypothetical protein [Bacteroidales bacterium]MBR1571003.1 hypothetical protein [Bacteroidales bacterium]
MENKAYSLVAWTDNGNLRMVPSLVSELSAPYQKKVDDLEARWGQEENEVGFLIALSRAWEEFARFFVSVDYRKQAWQCYSKAAMVCAYCSDNLWLQGTRGDFPVLPLLYRFLAMHARCMRLMKEDRTLQYMYRDSDLESHYCWFTLDDRDTEEEIRAGFEYMRAWRFGRNG